MTDDDRTAVLETSLIIGDRRVDDSKGGWMEHINPATGRPNPKKISVASVEEVDDAVTAACEGFKVWRSWTPDKRRDALFKLADVLVENSALLGTAGVLETGAPYSGYGGVYSADWIRYYAGWADKITGESITLYPFPGIDFTMPEPYGVVAVFVASNGPIGFFGMAGAPALAAGSSIVIKPPELAPYTSIIFGRLARSGPAAGRGQRRERRRRRRERAGRPTPASTRSPSPAAPPPASASRPRAPRPSRRWCSSSAASRRTSSSPTPTSTPRSRPRRGSPTTPARAARCRHACWSSGRSTSASIEGVHDSDQAGRRRPPVREGVTMGPVISEASANRIVGLITEAKDTGAGGGPVRRWTASAATSPRASSSSRRCFVDVDNSAPIAQTRSSARCCA